ncbi:MAG: hypothetical protein A3G18_10800 [Rhodospirillales bacterium RIFCSPLOWO2_12_FULL_58_28]|nr:MAG: hypothetical protein A3H92_11155 [Rhodospirillales bacterium RIFCSPLOWO2_02_FULL_58_16]OHC77908.1 MAG: hypothetical protein A3G18_10800 [Rhodospirillales bacterium RIFCSPLOWO2_12_FULL_58_28]
MKRRFLRSLSIAVVVILTGMMAAPAHADDAFVTGIDGLPLMPGLTESPGAGMIFDTPAGRIVEAYATGNVARNPVIDFYASTLPQLGWRHDKETTFSREDEALTLELSGDDKLLTIRFALSPTGSSLK